MKNFNFTSYSDSNEVIVENWDYGGMLKEENFFGTQKDWINTIIKAIDKIAEKLTNKSKEEPIFLITSAQYGGIINEDTKGFNLKNKTLNQYKIRFLEDWPCDLIMIQDINNPGSNGYIHLYNSSKL